MSKTIAVAKNKILGRNEHVSFPDFTPMAPLLAKIDTGAFTGSLHCTEIHEDEDKKGRVLKFSPFDHPDIEIQTRDYSTGPVKSSNGIEQERFFVNTRITIAGETLPITLTLADRSEMSLDVLIGRRFLAEHGFLVDVLKASK